MDVTTSETDALASGDYTLVVAVANPAHVPQLMRTAVDIAGAHDGRVHVVSVVHKRSSSPFALFADEVIVREYGGDRQAVLDRAVETAATAPVEVDGSVLVASNVAAGLAAAIDEVAADAVLVGWRGTAHPSDAVLGTTVDPLLRDAPCDVLVEKVGPVAAVVDSLLLPVAGGPDVPLAVDVAAAIARANDATVEVLSVSTPASNAAREHVDDAAARFDADVSVERSVLASSTVDDAIVAAAADHDVVVLGATRGGLFRPRIVGSVATAVGEHVDRPVIVARAKPIPSLFDRVTERLLG